MKRKRRCVSDIFEKLGPCFRRTYRMNEINFWKVYNILQKYEHEDSKKRKRKRDYSPPNDKIHFSLRVSVVIRYFSGASPYNLIVAHGMEYSNMYHSVWEIVDKINVYT